MSLTTHNDYNAQISDAEVSLKGIPVTTVDGAAEILSLLLRIRFWKANRVPDDVITAVASCRELLQRKPTLHLLLKTVHMQEVPNYSSIFDSLAFPALVSTKSREILQSIGERMEKHAATESFLPLWVPKNQHTEMPRYEDNDLLAHIASLGLRKSAELSYNLQIILHDLGGFQRHPVLANRVSRLFTPKNKFLVNASGTGKTRLCYEGLCANWGLYFTFYVDSSRLGSFDMEFILDSVKADGGFRWVRGLRAPDKAQVIAKNRNLVFRWFGVVLLSRLLAFQLFLETRTHCDDNTLNTMHKMRWLEMQLTPCTFSRGGTDDRFSKLSKALGGDKNDVLNLQANIDDALRKIRNAIGHDSPLFIVIDGAQAGVRLEDTSFDDGNSLLREIIGAWQTLTRGSCTFICAGIRVPSSMFSDKPGGDFEWTSDTGEFDDPDAHERYVTKFLPPKFRDTPSGRFLLARLWRWCRGRYQFTDKFISILLTSGLLFPHTTLSQYIREGTGVEAFDAVRICYEEVYPTPGSVFGFGKPSFEELSPHDQDLVLNVLYSMMATHQVDDFGPEDIQLVSRGYSRFVDADLSKIVFNEPLVVCRAVRQLFPAPSRPHEGYPNDRPSTFITTLQLNPPRTRRGVAHCLAFYLSQVLGRSRMLTDIFKFPHAAPGWACQTAQLVRFHLDDDSKLQSTMVDDLNVFRSLVPLATATQSLEETIEWIEHAHGTTFCIPSSPNLDLLGAIQLADGSFIWLAVRALATDEPVNDEALRPLVSLLDIDDLFQEEGADTVSIQRAINSLRTLPGVKQRPCLLRAVTAFPVEVDVRPCVDKRCRDVANLSFRALRRKEDQVMQVDFYDAMVNGAIGGTKRKSRWDDGAMQGSRKRAKELQSRLLFEFKGKHMGSSHEVMPHYTWDLQDEDLYEEYDPVDAVAVTQQRRLSYAPRKRAPKPRQLRRNQKGTRQNRKKSVSKYA
ncbi:hypothetical protein MIND_00876800 [Mycena indigotica]|uniref:Uncharacterized protein n=1 Tax=Mycena indigotica TaxID=2126181 RepID=A0A8H6VYX5_9AGAR|nr:uncharacterized protein MIND_00876800 [Mycena indigotica]KAF7299279.1 hypothetical protein MIND_00876800 [Mycena indigotica]